MPVLARRVRPEGGTASGGLEIQGGGGGSDANSSLGFLGLEPFELPSSLLRSAADTRRSIQGDKTAIEKAITRHVRLRITQDQKLL